MPYQAQQDFLRRRKIILFIFNLCCFYKKSKTITLQDLKNGNLKVETIKKYINNFFIQIVEKESFFRI